MSQAITVDDLRKQVTRMKDRIFRLEKSSSIGRIIDTQTLAGNNEGYRSFSTTTQNLTIDSGGTQTLQLTFTPDVDCWWEVRANIGILQKIDAAYNYAYGSLVLSPDDEDGNGVANQILTQHSTVDTHGFRSPQRIFKLAGEQTYTCLVNCFTSGGTWQFYQGSEFLWIEGKAWTR